eukprot:gene19829-23714_t
MEASNSDSLQADLLADERADSHSRDTSETNSNPGSSCSRVICYPYNAPRNFVGQFCKNFGWRFCFMLFCAYAGVKGALYTFIGSAQLPYYEKYMKISGQQYQRYRTIASTPWGTKALIGSVSDAFPLFGYHKSSYILISALLGTACFSVLAFLPIGEGSGDLAAAFFFLANFEAATVDLLCEGRYAQLMSERPEASSDIVTWVWSTYHVGKLFASSVTGPVAEYVSPRAVFLFCIPLAFQIVFPTALGYLGEERLPPAERTMKLHLITQQRGVFMLALAMAAGSLGLAFVLMFCDDLVQLEFAVGSSVVLCIMSYLYLPRQLASCNLYMFLASVMYLQLASCNLYMFLASGMYLQPASCNLYMFLASVMYLQVDGAVDYFYTADEQCLPDGPHFDFTYYLTYSNLVLTAAGALGVMLFHACFSGWYFRQVFWVTTVLRVVASVFDIAIMRRWNRHIGISDSVMYMCGSTIIYEVAYMLDFMPAVILTSKLCPKNMESTVYALLAGFQNFGQNVAKCIGLYMIDFFEIKTQEPCNYDNMWKLIAVSHCMLPLLTIPLTFILIPRARLTDSLHEDPDVAAANTKPSDEVDYEGLPDEEAKGFRASSS